MSEPRRIRIRGVRGAGGEQQRQGTTTSPYTIVEGGSIFERMISMLILLSVIEKITGATAGGAPIDTGELQKIINELRTVVDELEDAAEPVVTLADIMESFPQILDELRALAARKLYLAEIDVGEDMMDILSLSARAETRDDYKDITWSEIKLKVHEDATNIKAEFKMSILEGESQSDGEYGATDLLRR